jgi:hypothetical protein
VAFVDDVMVALLSADEKTVSSASGLLASASISAPACSLTFLGI